MKKKVSLIISHLQSGGAQRVVSNLSLGFSAIYNTFLVLHDGSSPAYPYSGNLIDLKSPVSPGIRGRIVNFFTRLMKLRRLKHQQHFQASISFLESSNLLNLLSGGRGKTIISVRNYKSKQVAGFFGVFYALVIRLLYGKSYRVVAASIGIKDDLVKNFGLNEEKITVIYNPYNLETIQNQARRELDQQMQAIFSKPVLITAGALSEQKGHRHLVRAFRRIKTEIPAMQLVILGRGELEEELKKLSVALQLEQSVHFPGFQSNPFSFISRSAIFILSSLYEGFPNVLVEAMACGTPVIATDCRSGPAEILAPQRAVAEETEKIELAAYGILTPVFKPPRPAPQAPLIKEEELLAQAVIDLYKDQETYKNYRQKGLQRVQDFNSPAIIERWINLIENEK